MVLDRPRPCSHSAFGFRVLVTRGIGAILPRVFGARDVRPLLSETTNLLAAFQNDPNKSTLIRRDLLWQVLTIQPNVKSYY